MLKKNIATESRREMEYQHINTEYAISPLSNIWVALHLFYEDTIRMLEVSRHCPIVIRLQISNLLEMLKVFCLVIEQGPLLKQW